MVDGFNRYKIQGILQRTQNFLYDYVHNQIKEISKCFNKIKRNLKKTKHLKQSKAKFLILETSRNPSLLCKKYHEK